MCLNLHLRESNQSNQSNDEPATLSKLIESLAKFIIKIDDHESITCKTNEEKEPR